MTGSVSFPVIRRLSVNEYGLYPGTAPKPGLQLEFNPGLTLVVGTNGLGKTTLATMLFRMLSGPSDLFVATLNASELGGSSLDATTLSSKQRSMFADRVSDRAANAYAVLELRLGGSELRIVRSLKTLALAEYWVDGALVAGKEAAYQESVVRTAGLSSFGDWLMFLRQLVFYFEDRRSLVWDASAQRQIFRMLFLPPDGARKLYERERDIMQMDSRIRNDNAALTRLQERVAVDDHKQSNSKDAASQVKSLRPLQSEDLEKQKDLLAEINEVDEHRRALRRQLLEAEDIASRQQEELEDSRLRIIHSQFPSKSETAKYLLSLLLLDGRCSVCSEEVPDFAVAIEQRMAGSCCVLCGSSASPISLAGPDVPTVESLSELRTSLDKSRVRVEQLQAELREVSDDYDQRSSHLVKLSDEIKARERLLASLVKSLPSDDEEQLKAKEELKGIAAKIAKDRVELEVLNSAFGVDTERFNAVVWERVEEIKIAFAKYAQDFLFEEVALKWAPQTRSLGQLNTIEMAAFDLDMGGTDFDLVHRRDGPSAVSESQREFIDLAFRMALIEVAGKGQGGTLVIDAPESSLDAVFVERAAEVLCRFGDPSGNNRLLIMSNLIDGRLLPDLIRLGVPEVEKEQRLLNLMEVAVPTAAVKFERGKYDAEWHQILKQGFKP